jgi:hypothetical protein
MKDYQILVEDHGGDYTHTVYVSTPKEIEQTGKRTVRLGKSTITFDEDIDRIYEISDDTGRNPIEYKGGVL